MTKQRYTEDFKKMIVDLHHSGKSIASLAREYGLFEYIEGFYNQARIHGSIGYLTPNEMQRKALIA